MTSSNSTFDIAALDWGSVRFGLAFGSTSTGLVIPYKAQSPNSQILEILATELKLRHISTLIVGIPAGFNGNPTKVTNEILEFIETLKASLPHLKVISLNERNTTKQAKSQGVLKGDKTMLNHVAATMILEHYLNTLN